jgi:hypothetical protein
MKAKPCCKHEKMWEEFKFHVSSLSPKNDSDKEEIDMLNEIIKLLEEKHADTD